jgi:hypothetical protein
LLLCSVVALAVDKPRVFIQESQSWEMKGAIGGADNNIGGATSGGARPQTAEIIKTFGERCPGITINNIREKADYVVVLDHEGGKDLIRRDNKVVIFNREGDTILSRSTRSLGNAVNDACNTISNDWSGRPAAVNASLDQSPINNDEAQLQISSAPAGADIEVNGAFVGSTPSAIHLKSGEYNISVKKNGFVAWERKMKVTGGDVNLVAELKEMK